VQLDCGLPCLVCLALVDGSLRFCGHCGHRHEPEGKSAKVENPRRVFSPVYPGVPRQYMRYAVPGAPGVPGLAARANVASPGASPAAASGLFNAGVGGGVPGFAASAHGASPGLFGAGVPPSPYGVAAYGAPSYATVSAMLQFQSDAYEREMELRERLARKERDAELAQQNVRAMERQARAARMQTFLSAQFPMGSGYHPPLPGQSGHGPGPAGPSGYRPF